MVTKRAAEQNQRREGQKIGVDEPGETLRTGMKTSVERRQCDIDDRSVDEGEAGAQDGGSKRCSRVLAGP